ncbi:hypothetical protein CPLU01_12397 [Colletotrichum plurivorum]|uniref:Heterokaryon incompatibility domain-containing protein n=1 Tax=Colletotrichum plurivorum TaxID=2175906 RepID=A0A8H6JYG2_9PEZI|nr:hypothetical protein CPLU01_12397 [Colletotrichum plurivorum]
MTWKKRPAKAAISADWSCSLSSAPLALMRTRLEGSDIKLCLNATHLYSGQGFEDAQVFDEILVQVGKPYSETEDGTSIWSCPLLRLSLVMPTDRMTRIEDLQIGRYEFDRVFAPISSQRIPKQWLSECCYSHTDCLTRDDVHKLPTRVIDVGTSSRPNDVRLVLSHGKKAKYAALSHCWGGAISPLLTTDTILAFQEHIDVPDLPANFRDTIVITRNLGIQFLWIDSLCIQQDSKRDWEMESKKMSLVYRNSTVTISALLSAGSKEGIIKLGQSNPKSPNPVTMKVLQDSKDSLRVFMCRKNSKEEDLRTLDRDGALTRRGWTLQGYILSPRHILYGKDMIYWRCPQGYISSDGLPEGNRSPQSPYVNLSQVIYSDILSRPHPPPSDLNIILDEYYDLVGAYSQRKLTYGSDKLPAFSGLVQRLHTVIGGDYIAGLWTTDFRNGLLWRAEMMSCHHARDPYRAPSWSWAVTDDLVLFERQDAAAKGSPSSAELLEYNVKPRNPDNPLSGRTGPARISAFAAFDEPLESGTTGRGTPKLFRVDTDALDTGDYLMSIEVKMDLFGDSPGTEWDIDFNLFLDEEYIVALIHTDDNTEEDAEWSNSEAWCLVLRQTPDDSQRTYERVGFAKIDSPPRLRWLKTWERQVLTLV